jgi:hypothetical protein
VPSHQPIRRFIILAFGELAWVDAIVESKSVAASVLSNWHWQAGFKAASGFVIGCRTYSSVVSAASNCAVQGRRFMFAESLELVSVVVSFGFFWPAPLLGIPES